MEFEFYWDVVSPYTYMAHTQLASLCERTGAEAVYRPFLLGGVMNATGNRPPATVPAKGIYMGSDLARWREHYEVPFLLPVREVPFPIRSVLPMRVALVLGDEGAGRAFADAVMRAYWAEGTDVSEEPGLIDLIGQMGFDAARVLQAASSPAVKQRLKDETDRAVQRGAFGAPTFFVGDEMFWGNDRLHFVEEALLR